jgi:gamma-glutamyltranspeptidase/glutathione hydrolase
MKRLHLGLPAMKILLFAARLRRALFAAALVANLAALSAWSTNVGAECLAPEVAARGQSEATLPPQLQTAEETSAYGMVASSIPDASRAGARILEQGGNAVDAAVATAFALGVGDPFYSGIGGLSYILIHLNDGRDVAIDGSVRAPITVVPGDLEVLKERGELYGYKTIAPPTTPATLAFALKRYGTMSLAQVLAPAIELAEFGHAFLPLAQFIVEDDEFLPRLRRNDFLARTFLKDGSDPWPLGHLYCQPVLAQTMRRMVNRGVEDFYSGQIAGAMAADILANGGFVSKADLALVGIVERTPVRGHYRGLDIVSFPYPGGGDIVVEALHILETFPSDLLQHNSVDRLHLLLEAEHVSMWDYGASIWSPLLSRTSTGTEHAKQRAALIRLDQALHDNEIFPGQAHTPLERETTHVSVVDRFGNAVSLTQSLGDGSYVATPSLGFHYNSLLESYDYLNRRSPVFLSPLRILPTTMAPTILLCNGAPFLVLGSPGSGRIPAIVVTVVSNVVDRGMALRDAVAEPRVLFNSPDERYKDRIFVELAGTTTQAKADELEARGFLSQHRLTFPATQEDHYPFGGVNAVMVDPATGSLVGVGDPRRQGAAAAPTSP